MTDQTSFKAWPKTPRAPNMLMTITEKIDGTNACVIIEEGQVVGVQSRKRLITPTEDNMGFAQWVSDNTEELRGLGDGYHYGEWAGPKIQKNPHNLLAKQFFLFDALRWSIQDTPACCAVVPVLYSGPVDMDQVACEMDALAYRAARDGYTPEGVIVEIRGGGTVFRFKETFAHPSGKWRVAV